MFRIVFLLLLLLHLRADGVRPVAILTVVALLASVVEGFGYWRAERRADVARHAIPVELLERGPEPEHGRR